jgi:hypothetical protein
MASSPREQRLHRCTSCARRVRPPDQGGRCEFCGGTLEAVWGLGQVATAPVEGFKSRVRDVLRGATQRPGREGRPSATSGPAPGAGRDGGPAA